MRLSGRFASLPGGTPIIVIVERTRSCQFMPGWGFWAGIQETMDAQADLQLLQKRARRPELLAARRRLFVLAFRFWQAKTVHW
jgi:hypothetical protein